MRYVSTRGSAPVLQFDEVLLAGLARDGGLYVPETWPTFSKDDIRSLRTLTYAEVAFKVIQPFVAGTVEDDALMAILDDTYNGFDHAAVAPLKQLRANDWNALRLWVRRRAIPGLRPLRPVVIVKTSTSLSCIPKAAFRKSNVAR